MNLSKYTHSEIPEESCVIRIKSTNQYIHVNDNNGLFIKSKMVGCLVLMDKQTAEDMVDKITKLDIRMYGKVNRVYEIIPFNEAYKAHGILDSQISCN